MIIAVIYTTFAVAKIIFFRLSFLNCKSYVYNCDDHPSFNSYCCCSVLLQHRIDSSTRQCSNVWLIRRRLIIQTNVLLLAATACEWKLISRLLRSKSSHTKYRKNKSTYLVCRFLSLLRWLCCRVPHTNLLWTHCSAPKQFDLLRKCPHLYQYPRRTQPPLYSGVEKMLPQEGWTLLGRVFAFQS